MEHLQRVHRENPGFTEKYSANRVDAAGMNTYQWLAEVIEKEDHKEILILRYYDDLSYAEIAEVLQVKLGTVMSRLSRARVRLLDVVEDGDLVN